ncbi:Protein FD [Glycine soja]
MEEVWKDINVFQDLTTIDSPNIILSSASSETGFSLPHFHFQSQPSSQHPPPSNKTSAQPPAADRRNKRMIKNRESAARSLEGLVIFNVRRAYTNELELEVEHLKEENARLKRQQQQLCEAASSEQKKKGTTLYRASTAPF